MSLNVFGTPITTLTLEGLPEYIGKPITRKDRAHVALNRQFDGDKNVRAQQYVDNLKANYGNGVSTKCIIYNATGDPLTYITSHDFYGRIGQGPYPVVIQNGQWGGFLHTKRPVVASGSQAVVVYRGMNDRGVQCDWLLGWTTPWGATSTTAYTEIRAAGYYSNSSVWIDVRNKLDRAPRVTQTTWNGCVSYVSIGGGNTSSFQGTMTLENAGISVYANNEKEHAMEKSNTITTTTKIFPAGV